MPLRRFSNEHDNQVIHRLATAPLGSLEVDRLAGDAQRPSEAEMIELRLALMKVYVNAAERRLITKVPKDKIKAVERTIVLLFRAATLLEKVKPEGHKGLRGVLGLLIDDPNGADEPSEFSSKCWHVKLAVAKAAIELGKVTKIEKEKSGTKGERKKRLRILVEELAIWWLRTKRKTIAPYVQAKRLDKHRAFVLGRRGRFLDLAISTFSKLDQFKGSEVTSAVSNVYEDWRRQRRKAN